jgi:transcriptional regulator with GAF, ATPase, and Fis domain
MSLNTDISVPKLDPEGTLDLILSALGELVDYELAVVLGLDSEDTLRVRKAAGPLATAKLAKHSIALSGRRDLARILERGVPQLFDEHEEHIDSYEGVLDLPHGHSCLVAPLSLGAKRIGLLTLDHRQCGRFSPGLLRFIATISKLISLSLVQSDEKTELERANAELVRERNALFAPGYEPIAGLIGSSGAWLKALEALRLVADTELPVLVLGETGTGKELASRGVHRLSQRAGRPFIAVNCSALAPSLAESELFGHEKGAFTGALATRKGRFELADGGTLFLDEIGDLPMELQPKLLRILQEGSFERVGGERSIRVDVRIVAATHVDLAKAVSDGNFREDLYYRLSVFPVLLPPLRERTGDALLLAERFLEDIRLRPGFSGLRLSEDAALALDRAPWPGNVRQLRNAIERAAILSRGESIRREHLALQAARPGQALPAHSPAARPSPSRESGARPPLSMHDAQSQAIREALAHSRGKIYGPGGAAEALGLKPSTLQSRMKKLGIKASDA